ncbi:MAG: hypothetical protein CMC98_00910 [Flavobacteriales bacterium]|nr:hypothetical protein [Flavobacteriales bacterium]|tara:strand:- start:3409 stop:4770 length:1362 start_codon:yes stop_codon:yes gene_type:complete
MKVLSLFDGISAGQQAFKNLGIEFDGKDNVYYASEIDKYAIQITQANHPNTKQLGDIKGIIVEDYYIFYNQNNNPVKNGGSFKSDIDLLIGGPPCQDLSIAKKNRQGLEGSRSSLFYEYVRILKKVKPKFFIMENVASMSKEDKDIISKELGVEPCLINSSHFTAQQRKRLYWVGRRLENGSYEKVDISYIQDKGIILQDILLDGRAYQDKSHVLTATYSKCVFHNPIIKKQRTMVVFPKEYEVRVNKVKEDFNRYLIECKKNNKITITEIANYCGLPKTQIEHYFRLDKSRAIPPYNIYTKLKKMLNLNDKFDSQIKETEILESRYESNLRAYNINGKSPTLTSSKTEIFQPIRIGQLGKGGQGDRIYSVKGKSVCLSANGGGRGAKTRLYKIDLPDGDYLVRKLDPIECERLQGFPDNYTNAVSNTQRYKALGNSFTVTVIEYIIKQLNIL